MPKNDAGPKTRCLAPGCTHSLRGKPRGTKTCSGKCRSAYARLQKRRRAAAAKKLAERASLPDHLAPVSEAVTHHVKDATHDVLKEELRPIVREALTQDVLDGLGDLVRLVPEAVALLGQDLKSRDETIRQRAYTLLLKYSVGNPAIAPTNPTAESSGAGVVVNFGVPRPDEPDAPATVDGTVACQECGGDGPFVANSERCVKCHDAVQARVSERFG